MWFEQENPEMRLSFWQCDEIHLPENLRNNLKLDITPRFLIYHKGELKKEIKGAKFVDLNEAVKEYIPQDPEDI